MRNTSQEKLQESLPMPRRCRSHAQLDKADLPVILKNHGQHPASREGKVCEEHIQVLHRRKVSRKHLPSPESSYASSESFQVFLSHSFAAPTHMDKRQLGEQGKKIKNLQQLIEKILLFSVQPSFLQQYQVGKKRKSNIQGKTFRLLK